LSHPNPCKACRVKAPETSTNVATPLSSSPACCQSLVRLKHCESGASHSWVCKWRAQGGSAKAASCLRAASKRTGESLSMCVFVCVCFCLSVCVSVCRAGVAPPASHPSLLPPPASPTVRLPLPPPEPPLASPSVHVGDGPGWMGRAQNIWPPGCGAGLKRTRRREESSETFCGQLAWLDVRDSAENGTGHPATSTTSRMRRRKPSSATNAAENHNPAARLLLLRPCNNERVVLLRSCNNLVQRALRRAISCRQPIS